MRATLSIVPLLLLSHLVITPCAVAQGTGFQLNRYEPTAAGEPTLAVEHPWFSGTRRLAAGLSLNYSKGALVFGSRSEGGAFTREGAILEHTLLGHLDVAAAFLDRLRLSLSLPVTLLEQGTPQLGVAPGGAAVGDPRIGARVRILGQPERGAWSLSAGADLWIPINLGDPAPFSAQTGERSVRFMARVIAAGLLRDLLLWSANASFTYRPEGTLGTPPEAGGNTMGPELHLAASLRYANARLRLSAGPEAVFGTILTGGRAFQRGGTGLELLLGAHYNVARLVQLSIGGGLGLLGAPGTPEGRLLLRASYAPLRAPRPLPPRDGDGDGVPDRDDACPAQAGERSADPRRSGCPAPPPDGDGDGVVDAKDRCPAEAAGQRPDPAAPGCPLRDEDGDGVVDAQDRCPREAAGPRPDPAEPGCPERDGDGDGVRDRDDQCRSEPAGPTPDPKRSGCPDRDSDRDGVLDGSDQCPAERAGLNPDPQRKGCPLPDRDRDQVPDASDACPDTPGGPSKDPRKNGCPGIVMVSGGQIRILKQVFFANGKDAVLKKSKAVLDAVAFALQAMPLIRRVEVQGHTDDKGAAEVNRELSERRAKSVVAELVQRGVEPARLVAKGYGPDRPIADNKSKKGKAQNRRIDFVVLEPEGLPAPTAPPGQEAAPKRRKGRR